MQQKVFHGILVDRSFVEYSYPEKFKLFAKEQSGDWTLFGIEVQRKDIEFVLAEIRSHMRDDQPFYGHLYDDEVLIVIFKDRVFRVTPHRSTWDEIMQYGLSLKIPAEQLDFWPNRFQDEIHYFKKISFIVKA